MCTFRVFVLYLFAPPAFYWPEESAQRRDAKFLIKDVQKRKSLEANTSCSGENRIFTTTVLFYRYDFKAKCDGRTGGRTEDMGEITKKNVDITKFLMVLSSRLRISYV